MGSDDSADAIDHDLLEKAIGAWGTDLQMWMAVEELGEAQTAIARWQRGRGGRDAAVEEIADAIIMAHQMAVCFGEDEVAEAIGEKQDRLRKRVLEEMDA